MIYLDSNATTQVHPEVLEAMMPFLTDQCYNPSSGYRAGKVVKEAVENARDQVASLIGAESDDIYFTGCGTEANNAVLYSLATMCGDKKRIVTTQKCYALIPITQRRVLRFFKSRVVSVIG